LLRSIQSLTHIHLLLDCDADDFNCCESLAILHPCYPECTNTALADTSVAVKDYNACIESQCSKL